MLVKTVHQVDKDLLRILMAAFYKASPHARDLYHHQDGHISPSHIAYQREWKKEWERAALAGPPYPVEVDKKVHSNLEKLHGQTATASKANLLTELKNFVQQLRLAKEREKDPAQSYCSVCKQFCLSATASVPGIAKLEDQIKTHFIETVHALDIPELQELVLSSEFSPEALDEYFAPPQPPEMVTMPPVSGEGVVLAEAPPQPVVDPAHLASHIAPELAGTAIPAHYIPH